MKSSSLFFSCCLLAFAAIVHADDFKIPLRISDASGDFDTLWFGVNSNATYCIDDALGESEVFPAPPTDDIYVRFVDTRAGSNRCLGLGVKLDLRTFISTTQVDSYQVAFVGGTPNFPYTLSWPDLHSSYANTVRLRNDYAGTKVNVDMKAQNSFVVTDSVSLYKVLILTGDPAALATAPSDLHAAIDSYNQSSAIISGGAIPNGSMTSIWFEWGTTSSYGNTTATQSIGGGYTEGRVVQVLTALSPATVYHFRVVAQNSLGTSLGNDGTFATVAASGTGGSIVVPLEIQDHGTGSGTIYFGVYPGATYCVDPSLGEFELWPTPPGFDARIGNRHCPNMWLNADLHPLVTSTQVDSYFVKIQPGDGGYPVTLSWTDLNGLYTNPVWLEYTWNGSKIRVDMKAQTSFVMPDSMPLTSFWVITGNGGQFVSAPSNLTAEAANVTQTSSKLGGTANPNGLTTMAWFEWGTTLAYDHATTHHSVGTPGSINEWLLGLAPRTTYHFRIVAQNNMGTTYGDDKVFATLIDGVVGQHLLSLDISDNGTGHGTLWIGVHPDATNCIDNALGESELPPPPPASNFDIRLIEPCSNTGVNADFRHLTDTTQVDTFKIRFQPGYNDVSGQTEFPMTFSWPDVNIWFNGPIRLVDPYGGLGVNLDMKSQSSFSLPESLGLYSLLIKTGHEAPQPLPPSVLTNRPEILGASDAQLRGVINPNGFATDIWFEWGASAGYGNSTTMKSVGDGSSVVSAAETIHGLTSAVNYHYRIVANNVNGTMYGPDRSFGTSGVTGVPPDAQLPETFRLYQNYPNPFNPTTEIRYTLPEGVHVTLKIHNILGALVETLIDEYEEAGSKSITFDARALPSGVYYYRLQAGGFTEVKKMIVLR